MSPAFHSGFVAILGRPNAGKSTFVNRVVGRKVAIVTPRPQTTLNRIQGVANRPNAQVVLIDTPGIHRAHSALARQMMQEVRQALDGIDVLAVMIDASEGLSHDDRDAFQRAQAFDGPVFLLLNKIDRIPKPALLPLLEECAREGQFETMIPISALTGDGVEIALNGFIAHLPEGKPYFPEDQFTDQPERFLAGEIVREKAMRATHNEVPHSVAVIVEAFEESPKLLSIRATVYVERDGQKGILIGRGGAMLKQIGVDARKELEELFAVKVFLDLRVKVLPGWREDPRLVSQMDWRRQIERLEQEPE